MADTHFLPGLNHISVILSQANFPIYYGKYFGFKNHFYAIYYCKYWCYVSNILLQTLVTIVLVKPVIKAMLNCSCVEGNIEDIFSKTAQQL